MYSVLLIGLGNIGVGYDINQSAKTLCLTHAKAFSENPDFNLIAGVDVCKTRRDRFSKKYKCQSFADIEDAMNTIKPDVVVLATPTASHLPVMESVFEFGRPKLILCEKPLADTYEKAEKMVRMCNANKCDLYVNFFRRVEKSILEVKERITNESIKLPAKGLLWYSKGLLNSCSHFLDLLTFLFGPVIDVKVTRKGDRLATVDPEPDFEICFQNANINCLALNAENFFHNTLELIFENGLVKFDKACASTTWQKVVTDPQLSSYKVLDENKENFESNFFAAQRYVVKELTSILEQKKTVLASGDEALIVQNLLKTIMEDL